MSEITLIEAEPLVTLKASYRRRYARRGLSAAEALVILGEMADFGYHLSDDAPVIYWDQDDGEGAAVFQTVEDLRSDLRRLARSAAPGDTWHMRDTDGYCTPVRNMTLARIQGHVGILVDYEWVSKRGRRGS
jgi:hypothetical protein